MILVGAKLPGAGAIHDAVVAVDVWRADASEQQRHRPGIGGGGRNLGDLELVVLARARAAAGGHRSRCHDDYKHSDHRTHGELPFCAQCFDPPGLRSRGPEERSRAAGLALIRSVNSFRFSVVWRMFSSSSSMFSAFTSSMRSSCAVSEDVEASVSRRSGRFSPMRASMLFSAVSACPMVLLSSSS